MSVMPSMDAIAQFQVLASNYPPDYGIASGATFSLALKSGSQKFHARVGSSSQQRFWMRTISSTSIRGRVLPLTPGSAVEAEHIRRQHWRTLLFPHVFNSDRRRHSSSITRSGGGSFNRALGYQPTMPDADAHGGVQICNTWRRLCNGPGHFTFQRQHRCPIQLLPPNLRRGPLGFPWSAVPEQTIQQGFSIPMRCCTNQSSILPKVKYWRDKQQLRKPLQRR